MLASQSQFDIVDFMICEMEDTIADGIRARRHLPYAHWISFLIMTQVQQTQRGLMTELEQSPTEFTVYLMIFAIDYRRGNRVLR